jgi:hypothetical protein
MAPTNAKLRLRHFWLHDGTEFAKSFQKYLWNSACKVIDGKYFLSKYRSDNQLVHGGTYSG